MKLRLLDILSCPLCGGILKLQVLMEEKEVLSGSTELPSCRKRCAFRGTEVSGGEPCRECYSREIVEGVLTCRCGGIFPVVQGVPRMVSDALDSCRFFFVKRWGALKESMGEVLQDALNMEKTSVQYDKHSQKSFGLQWKIYRYQDRTWYKDLDLRVREFLHNMALSEDEIRGSLILDMGCGNGRLTAAVSRYGIEMVGMDFTPSVERAQLYKREFAGDRSPIVHFVQGDIFQPPFQRETFDHIHSSGVLHHTPSPDEAFIHFSALVRSGGHSYVQLYRKRSLPVTIHHILMRSITRRIPPKVLYPLCYLGVPINTLCSGILALLRGEPSPPKVSFRERAVVIFDNYSPWYQYRFHPHEVEALFLREGFVDIRDVTLENERRQSIAFVGRKP